MELKTPFVLILIPLIAALWWFLNRRERPSTFLFSSTSLLEGIGSSLKQRLFFLPPLLKGLAVLLFLIALAGPRLVSQETKTSTEGIDIVLALDVSGSMAAEDFQINGHRESRFEIIKTVVEDFIDQRANDRIGLVAFGARAYTVAPLTTDHPWLKTNLERLHLGIIEDGTAIGSGISTSVLRLKNSKAKSHVVVLLTDGVNNAGKIAPLDAAKIAEKMGIKVYTIGAGTKGLAPFPVTDVFGHRFYQNVQIDLNEDDLKAIAQITHAQYFRATDTESLRTIYKEIDRLEKTKIEETGYKEYKELFPACVIAALILLGLEIVLSSTWLLRIP